MDEVVGGDAVSDIDGKTAGYWVGCAVCNWVHVVVNVVDIAIGSSVDIL